MSPLTRRESRTLQVVLLLIVSGLVGRIWLQTRPPAPLPPLTSHAEPAAR